jgi:membrane-associated phospholipid phosphatase
LTSERIASIFSLVFNPAIVAAFAFLILLYPENTQNSLLLIGICLAFGTLAPLALIYQLSERGLISDFYVTEKEERAKPFAGAILSYLVGSLALLSLRAPTMVTGLMLCYAVNTLIMMLTTLRWKISVHASGIAGPTTTLMYGLGPWAAIFFALLLPVGWARIKLKAHTPAQVLAGALLTVVATWLQLRIYFAVL